MHLQSATLIVGSTALFYVTLFLLNGYLFADFFYWPGLAWVFLPSGVRLIAVLLFDKWGALGIFLGGVMLAFQDLGQNDPEALIVAAGISGMAPLMARQICLRWTDLDANLHALSPTGLLRTALIFSTTSVALGQAWITYRGVSDGTPSTFLVLLFGDILGSVLVLYAAKVLLSLITRQRGG